MDKNKDYIQYNDENENSIYKRLAHHLDNLPAGFPATESGVDLRLLRKLFTSQEAALAIHLTLIPEEASVIAHRAKLDPQLAEKKLENMAKKGLIFSIKSSNKPMLYMASQIVIGIWEYHVQSLDRGLIDDMTEYIPVLFKEAWKVPQLRTIPVNQSLSPKLEVMTYEKAEELIKMHKKILVAPCICRRERKIAGEGCNKPEESCLIFGSTADYYERNGLGRIIEQSEALEIIKNADEAGLVLQPGNAQRAANICCCCGCCCGVLRTLKQMPNPVDWISSPFYAVSEPDLCEGCSVCLDRCQMEALTLEENKTVVNLNRCIGCGLCVSSCPNGALTLKRKTIAEQSPVPRSTRSTYIELGRQRGKLGYGNIAKMFLKSKIDRLINHFQKV